MKNLHSLKKGESVVLISHGEIKSHVVSHVCSRFIHLQDMLFYKTSGRGANIKAQGLKIDISR